MECKYVSEKCDDYVSFRVIRGERGTKFAQITVTYENFKIFPTEGESNFESIKGNRKNSRRQDYAHFRN